MNEEDAYVNTKDMDMANAKQACAKYWEKSKDDLIEEGEEKEEEDEKKEAEKRSEELKKGDK